MVSAGHVGGTRDSASVSIAADGMSVVRAMRAVVGCVICVCVWLWTAWVEKGVSV